MDNYSASIPQAPYSYSCTLTGSGEGLSGVGNITSDPQFLDWYHISIYSPCRGAGSALYASGTDLDGEPWNDPPSMGCDEVVVSNRTGPLSVSLSVSYEFSVSNVLVSSKDWYHLAAFTGKITGLASYLSWNFGDGTMITNGDSLVLHWWTNTGNYTVVFTAYNLDNPAGVSTSLVVPVVPVVAPQLLSPVIVSSNVEFQFTGQLSAYYTVQYTTNLAPPVTWSTLQTIISSPGGVTQIQDSAPTNACRFYRVRAQ